MPPPLTEFDLQRAFVLWLTGHPASPCPLLPGVKWWHTPNGGSRRDAWEGKRLKQIGLKAGIPDLLFLWGGLYGMEWKRPGERPTDVQIAMQAALRAAGMVDCVTVDNLDDAKETVRKWGLTVPFR